MQQVPRRTFLIAAGGVLFCPTAGAAPAIPTGLDHVILGCNNLDRGIRFVEERTGVRATVGGVHPGRGTWNALLSLGGRSYLEILAPDPKQSELTWFRTLPTISEPRLIGWVVKTADIDARAKRLAEAGFALVGPKESSRQRPDGRVLKWRKLDLLEDRGGLLPAFIQWAEGSLHPSEDAPPGCRLTRLDAGSPNLDDLRETYRPFGVDIDVRQGDEPELRARIESAKGISEFTSAT
jgi:hypothetical protein